MVSYIVERLEEEAGDEVDFLNPKEDLDDWKYACRIPIS